MKRFALILLLIPALAFPQTASVVRTRVLTVTQGATLRGDSIISKAQVAAAISAALAGYSSADSAIFATKFFVASAYAPLVHSHNYATPAAVGDSLAARANDYATIEHNHAGVYQPAGTYATPGSLSDTAQARANDYATVEHNHAGVYQPAGTYATPSSVHDSVLARADDYMGVPLGSGAENYIPKWSASVGRPVWRPDSAGAGVSGIDAATAASMIHDSAGARANDYATAEHNHTGTYQPAGTYATPVSLSDTAQARANDYATVEHNHTGTYQPVGTYATPSSVHDSVLARADDYSPTGHNHTGTYTTPANVGDSLAARANDYSDVAHAHTGTYTTPTNVRDSLIARADDYAGVVHSHSGYLATPGGTGQENYVPKWSAAAGGPVWRPDSTGAGGSGISAETAAGMINDSLDNSPLVHFGVYNVKKYGAVGDGSTSDSAAIQNAINAAYTAGGGEVYIPAGTYIANVKIKSNVKLRGAGFNLTTLKSRAGSNRSVVQSDSFYTWTGSTTFGGNVDFEISHMTIDANKAANADSGYGVRVYGKRFKIFDVTIQNAKQDGMYTEWGGTASYNNPSEDQEAFVGRIKTIFNDGNGWQFKGPGDMEVNGVLSYQNKAWGIKVMSPMHLSQYNGYLNDTGAVHICYSGVIFGSDIHATTATGWGMLIDAGVGCSSISDISATGPIGVEIRAVGQVITGIVQNTTDTGVKFDGGSANLTLTMTGNSGYWFDLANIGGTNNVIVSAQNGADGALFKPAQYPGPYDTWFVGGAPSGYTGWRFKPPQDKLYVNGWEPVLPATNDTLLANTALKIWDGKAAMPSIPVYANNSAALSGGLIAGMLYMTSTGELRIVY